MTSVACVIGWIGTQTGVPIRGRVRRRRSPNPSNLDHAGQRGPTKKQQEHNLMVGPGLSSVATAGTCRMFVQLREVVCQWEVCGRVFLLCRSCDRGHRYCSHLCRTLARAFILRKARLKYAASRKGKKNNAERQRRWRQCRHEKPENFEKTVTEHSSQASPDVLYSVQHRSWKRIDACRPSLRSAQEVRLPVRTGLEHDTHRTGSGSLPVGVLRIGCCRRCGREGIVVEAIQDGSTHC